ncbi:alkaline phosphatase family protein [Bacillus sp. S/N-304-OC-R1]|uniref:alkaline phosphatase family protein n=1 Tax=Bacillus sp. S/N-304-OC-R1 TaxID=2758034 RepID=UPI001C8EA548|nr:ectonucleotide pyrophosphatase/phosphodiesterase [Bacillus sp. S/N-304-OC-R1]MBY0120980.1 alkaline phosphatase family protein [Bacillus sp. S/N-304-OC-R1]
MTALSKYMVVISFDCLSSLDIDLLKTLPNFQRFFQIGSFASRVETIYPSLTYPCHATIVTGKYPIHHGIINNTLLQPGYPSPDWNWYRSGIKGTTLFDEANRANLTTAALLWPVTGKAKSIQYNLPEIFPNRPWQNQLFVSLLNGTPSYQWELNKLFGYIRHGLNQPELDDFVLESTVHTILTKNPNLLLVHFTDLDTQRHQFGVFSKEAEAAIRRHDHRLGRILDALEKSGRYEETSIVVLGDHSALDEKKAIHLNVILKEKGLISLNKKGRLINWQAYCKSCDGSAYIYLKNQEDNETKTTLKHILKELKEAPENGIESVISGEEAGRKGADSKCLYMVEARKGYYFHDAHNGPFIKHIKDEDVRKGTYTYGSHGYSPEKPDYATVFFIMGKGIQKKAEIPYMRLVDIGPTLAKVLGLSLGKTDGEVMLNFLDLQPKINVKFNDTESKGVV